MSISNQTETISNPANQIFRWKGSAEEGEGNFMSVYNTDTKITTQEDEVTFMILDQLACITGYSPKYDGSIWTNEVHYTGKEELKLEVKDKESNKSIVLKEGLYQEIKETATANGGKYTKVIYALELDKENTPKSAIPIRVYLSGSSLGVFSNLNPTDGSIVRISKGVLSPKEKGKVAFYPPKIEILPANLSTPELKNIAIEIDTVLQAFFKRKTTEAELDETSNSQPQSISTPGQTYYGTETQELPDLSEFEAKSMPS